MILDRIENAPLYRGLGKRLAAALDILKANQLPWLELGKHELDGLRLYANIQEYQTKPRAQGLWEAHRRYIDVQYLARGCELIGHAPLSQLGLRQPYDDEKDVVFLDGSSQSLLELQAGMFAIFFPHDAHMPSLAVAAPQLVRKVVVKVQVE